MASIQAIAVMEIRVERIKGITASEDTAVFISFSLDHPEMLKSLLIGQFRSPVEQIGLYGFSVGQAVASKADLPAIHAALKTLGLATANIGKISDIIACPGMDYCALATARSIPVAQEIATRFDELKLENDIGDLKIKISGCINACGHHHVGHIGILGLDRAGVENYQITLGGDHTETAAVGQRTGPGFAYDEIVPAVERIVDTYLAERSDAGEAFIDTFRRVGMEPFKTALYGETERRKKAA